MWLIMIVEFGGGNDRIAEYLVTGIKSGRSFTRDELDHRAILSGDLSLTDKIIHSIPDKGQERYLHITLSFAEDDISLETLQAITSDYENLFMTAYDEEEYSFYAEAHLPKIKNIVDNRTGELKQRKPHVHIVIPRVNLLSGKSLNPRGDLTKRSTQEQLDAIQEHINLKYELISPKERPRDSDNHRANIISRIKGDFFKEKQSGMKQDILEKMENNKINNVRDFMELLKSYGEVKIRNEGKNNEYFAVKFKDDKKFTNLKNLVFSKAYIENRTLPAYKPKPDEIEKNLNKWLTRTSHEIRFVWSASEKIRAAYKSLGDEQKKFLNQRRQEHERKYTIKSEDTLRTGRRQTGYKRGAESVTTRNYITKTIGLPRLPKRGLDYGIPGRTTSITGFLSGNEKRDLTEYGTEGKYSGRNVRRNANELWRTRGIKQVNESTFLHESLYQITNQQEYSNQDKNIKEIRDNIEPERFLSEMQKRFFIDATNYKVSYTADHSPRFQVGKRNLNACDFLTKHINLSWADAKEIITHIYDEQKNNKPFKNTKVIFNLNPYEVKQRFKSLKQSNAFLKDFITHEKRKVYDDIKTMRKDMYILARKNGMNYDIVKGIIVHEKLIALELLDDKISGAKNLITQYHFNWNEEKNSMKAIAKLKKSLEIDEVGNSISSGESDYSLKESMEANQRRNQFITTSLRMKNLIRNESDNKITYLSPDTKTTVFIDMGRTLTTGKQIKKENITLMLEYAKEKYGGVLNINGTEKFKKMCAEIAAENNMDIILKPEKYNDLMREIKQKIQTAGAQPQAELADTATNPDNDAVKAGNKASAMRPLSPETANQSAVKENAENEFKSALTEEQALKIAKSALAELNAALQEEKSFPTEKERIQRPTEPQITWLNVPYERKDEAKMLGARWDKDVKRWYVQKQDLTPFRDFLPENQLVRARTEFKAALQEAGLIIDELPEMDGELHRVPVEGGKRGAKDGAYKGFFGKFPSGYIENFKTGYKGNWKLNETIYTMTSAELAAKKQADEIAREKAYTEKAKEIVEQFNKLPDAPVDHSYLKTKGLKDSFGAKLDEKGNLVLPLKDPQGNITTVQKIGANGFKQYEKGGKVSGSCMVIGDASLADSENIFISTGFATSATIHTLTEKPVIATFQDSNLKKISQSIHEQYPDKQIVIFGDDDRHNEEKGIANSGREKATEAADAVGGIAIFPQFEPTEQGSQYSDFSDLYRERGAENAKQQIAESLEEQLQQKNDEMEM